MMNRKIALIPIDARPVTRELPKQIAKIGGWEVLLPEKEMLGFLKRPGNIKSLSEWLLKVAPQVDGFVLSTDMLAYGGLVPSRINTEELQVILKRLELILHLKKTYPEKPIMAFSATMRISNNYVNEEEKEYWKDYGEEIWQYSYHTHRFVRTECEDSKTTVERLSAVIPTNILQDYLQTRERNFQVNLSLLDQVENGTLDVLVFPQDDTSEYGLNIEEQERLTDYVRKRQLSSKVFIYPGADEVANTLISRLIYTLENVEPPSFFPFYSGETGSHVHAMYEDRPICESVKGQIYAFGSYTVDNASDADIVFAVNVPGKRQGDLALQKFLGEVDTSHRNIGEWISRILHYVKRKKLVGIADVAYANGADPSMLPSLLDKVNLSTLCGFGAWNTAGNTLGTVVAQSAMVYLQKAKPSVPFEDVQARMEQQMVLRLLDDYLYQTIVRQQVRKAVKTDTISDETLLQEVTARFHEEAKVFLEKYSLTYEINDIYLPWNRTFEIGICLEEKGAN
ncbi:DUF4127 family protein [Sutcliffiella horikoshii]|uniref:DUF4127 family protein n=1 Tax=Sutcliffiella horikoshii TaxID=79883 RepID=A0A5D4T3E8_9BACI|nr:DUF4127 family protein [Sutcliffiella horikoshii]TYS69819.1 DUF4127 family protein [Sutcliffiella horikoshii]